MNSGVNINDPTVVAAFKSVVWVSAGSMIGHGDVAYIIDQTGHVREEPNTAPGPGTTASKSSFAVLLADAARQYPRMS